MIKIKELNIDYIEEIKSLFCDIFTNEPWNDDWSDASQLHEYILDLIGNRNSLTLGIYEDNKLIGLSMGSIMHWWIGTEYYIYEFCVKADKQRQGVGTEFLKCVEEYVKRLNVTHIFLQTERTVPAYEFYKKNGFVELNEHVSLFKEFN
ncbi:MAG: GNAT family N-acetyltransferase [Lachnospiraceae bacterium]|nr:GNAT family N-acetyltransferase [Lachnospiraceae bacterium]